MPTLVGRKGSFRYLDARGGEIGDEATLERIRKLAITPAWTDVWIAARPRSKLQATGYDQAGRKQYRYHPDYRAAQDRAKFERLVRFGERLPALRSAMAEHLDKDELDRDRVCAIALRLIDLGWFRIGTDRHMRVSGTYGITTLRKHHVSVRGHRVRLEYVGKGRSQVRTSLVDDELAAAIRPAIRSVAERLGNTPTVCRQSYVAPAVVDAYLEGRTLADFRPRHLRAVAARQTGLEPDEEALLRLLYFE